MTKSSQNSLDLAALIREALGTPDEDMRRDELLLALHRAPTPLVIAAIRALDRTDPNTMVLVADIVAQLRYEPDDPLRAEAFGWLHEAIRRPETDVVSAAAIALHHAAAAEHESTFVELSMHPSPGVRYAAAVGLGSLDSSEAAETLAKLCMDSDRDVRNWAAFGLTLNLKESDAIEHALWECSVDTDDEVRAEAIVALTSRHLDTYDAISRELGMGTPSERVIDAILLRPHREWCSPLRRCQTVNPELRVALDEAIAACCSLVEPA